MFVPYSKLSATIRAFSSLVHRRRPLPSDYFNATIEVTFPPRIKHGGCHCSTVNGTRPYRYRSTSTNQLIPSSIARKPRRGEVVGLMPVTLQGALGRVLAFTPNAGQFPRGTHIRPAGSGGAASCCKMNSKICSTKPPVSRQSGRAAGAFDASEGSPSKSADHFELTIPGRCDASLYNGGDGRIS